MRLVPLDKTVTAEDFSSWIVWRDGGLVIVNKPAGVLSQGGPGDRGQDLVALARAAFRQKQVAVLHRLDRNVSGLVMLALDATTARLMSAAFAEGRVERHYRAVVCGAPASDTFEVDVPLIKDARTNEVRVAKGSERDAKPALSRMRVLARAKGLLGAMAELDVEPVTGRSHQLRVHLTHAGLPIVGDPKYGVLAQGVARPLLHAQSLAFEAPRKGPALAQINVQEPPPWRFAELVTLKRKRTDRS